jgi:hypothetical protein
MTDTTAIDIPFPIARRASDRPVPLHRLVYLEEDGADEVTIGRPDVDRYCIVSPDAAATVRRLEAGDTPRAVAAWYEAEYGGPLDIDDFVAALREIGFVRAADEPLVDAEPVRWRRLAAAIFSKPALVLYAVLVSWAVLATVSRPDLLPSYRHLFFTDYFAVMQVVLFAMAVPQLLLHEGFHALAGRRLGLRSRLSVGRRLYFVVLETSMDGLVAVPRRKRYLPILAGMLSDVVVIAALTIVADLTRDPGGAFSFAGRLCLAFAVTVWLRLIWQFSFYLRTDLYVLICTVLGCVDLHDAAKHVIRNRVNRLLGRRDRLVDESALHAADRRAARWYAWFVVLGYLFSLSVVAFVGVPTLVRIAAGIGDRVLGGSGASWKELADSFVVLAFLVVQLVVLGWIFLRERRSSPVPSRGVTS